MKIIIKYNGLQNMFDFLPLSLIMHSLFLYEGLAKNMVDAY